MWPWGPEEAAEGGAFCAPHQQRGPWRARVAPGRIGAGGVSFGAKPPISQLVRRKCPVGGSRTRSGGGRHDEVAQ
eukprot:6794988-Pyramimonas_sp.AAC.1